MTILETAPLALYLALPAVGLWIAAIATGFLDRHPPVQEDAAQPLRELADSWGAAPARAKSRFGVDANPDWHEMEMMRVVSRRARAVAEDKPLMILRVESADGTVRTVKQGMAATAPVTPETLLPVGTGDKNDQRTVATGQPVAELRRSLLAYRLARGLIDRPTHQVLTNGEPVTVAVRGIRPTGRVHSGHLEVDLAVGLPDGTPGRLVGFLRPHEVTAVRQTGLAPACHVDGQWVLGPTWY